MFSIQGSWLRNSAGVSDGFHLLHYRLRIARHTFRLIGHDQAALQLGIVGGNACRTGVLIALQGLNAAKRQHESAGRHGNIGSGTQRPGHLPRIRQLAAGDNLDAIA